MQAAAAPPLTASGAVTWRYAGYDKMLRPDGHASSHNLHAEQFEIGVAIHSGIDANLQMLVCLVETVPPSHIGLVACAVACSMAGVLPVLSPGRRPS